MVCKVCGKEYSQGTQFCPSCGVRISSSSARIKHGMGGLIPNNKFALWAYYLGVFSIACCFTTGIPAIICGCKGLKYAKEHNGVGKTHSLVGIVLGSATPILWIIVVAGLCSLAA